MITPTTDDHRERLGIAAYNAYVASVGGVTWDGKPIPAWPSLTDKIREAWRCAAVAAVDAVAFLDIDAADVAEVQP